jgi:hypothetical protein
MQRGFLEGMVRRLNKIESLDTFSFPVQETLLSFTRGLLELEI